MSVFLGVCYAPTAKERGQSAPQLLVFLFSIDAYTICRRTTKFDVVTHVGEGDCGVATPFIPKVEFQGSSVWRCFCIYAYAHCWGKRVQQLKKRKKSCFFWILKKKNVKNRRKRTYSFTGHLITHSLILNYRKSVPVSHQHQTSCSEMRTQETMQLRNVCDKRL